MTNGTNKMIVPTNLSLTEAKEALLSGKATNALKIS
jgi:hypothetical protein